MNRNIIGKGIEYYQDNNRFKIYKNKDIDRDKINNDKNNDYIYQVKKDNDNNNEIFLFNETYYENKNKLDDNHIKIISDFFSYLIKENIIKSDKLKNGKIINAGGNGIIYDINYKVIKIEFNKDLSTFLNNFYKLSNKFYVINNENIFNIFKIEYICHAEWYYIDKDNKVIFSLYDNGITTLNNIFDNTNISNFLSLFNIFNYFNYINIYKQYEIDNLKKIILPDIKPENIMLFGEKLKFIDFDFNSYTSIIYKNIYNKDYDTKRKIINNIYLLYDYFALVYSFLSVLLDIKDIKDIINYIFIDNNKIQLRFLILYKLYIKLKVDKTNNINYLQIYYKYSILLDQFLVYKEKYMKTKEELLQIIFDGNKLKIFNEYDNQLVVNQINEICKKQDIINILQKYNNNFN